jgi:hypothetical protein
MKPANYGPFYAAGLYPQLAEIFRSHGYALAVHGSLASDFDLIAVPWVEEAGDPQAIAEEINSKFAAKFSKTDYATRPHGRIAYKLNLSFGDCSLDVSFMPRSTVETTAESCMHKWTVLGAPRNPYPDALCEGGCGRTYANVSAENRTERHL